MLKRNIRLRREYLYKKSLESSGLAQSAKRRRVTDAASAGQPLPTELRSEAVALAKEATWDDEKTEKVKTHEDDEYANAGITDPVVLITTSRDPSSRLSQFAKELRLIFPGSDRLNRGGTVLPDLVDLCRRRGATDLVIAHEHRGEPDGLVVCHLPHGPTAYFGLSNAVLRHDIPGVGTASEAHPHLIFNNFKTKLGDRCASILKHLFPVPKPDSKRVITFANERDYVSFRHHTYEKKGHRDVTLTEAGPRFEMKLFQVRLGTVDQPEAESEWVLRPYMSTGKKRERL
eukprot:TRINITY_DN2413_c0_g1_i1.p2 TRINITY_DN2413_c0_g1~~TRINITY_DN2413_c0_g1_i1.p2  ORF type:complete len:335 (+),score=62.24 TRINITY_DN2413_c0_g1_i1:143-1006(+)